MSEDYNTQVDEFLNSIGIPCHRVREACGSFLVNVRITNGELYYDQLALASDMLHEAGHIAIFPPEARSHLSGDLKKAYGVLQALMEASDDETFHRKAMQTSDPEATAWAYAAGKHIGLPDDVIIRDEDYDDTGDSIRFGLSLNSYLGINGLHHAGFCTVKSEAYAKICGLPVYPTLAKWLQD